MPFILLLRQLDGGVFIVCIPSDRPPLPELLWAANRTEKREEDRGLQLFAAELDIDQREDKENLNDISMLSSISGH